MKRILSAVLALALLFSLGCTALAAERGSLSHFRVVNPDSHGYFTDVFDWYTPYVESAYSLDLLQGGYDAAGNPVFYPQKQITLVETVTLADRLHNIYHGNGVTLTEGAPWYQVYIDYAVTHGILKSADEFADYTKPATRAQFADLLARALPDEVFTPINTIEVGAIRDVDMSEKYSFAVYKLYRAGILTGIDSLGSFRPDAFVTRAEVATIASRIVDTNLRQEFDLYAPLYVGFTKSPENQGLVQITGLTMTSEIDTFYLTINFKSQESRFLSLFSPSESAYLLKVVEIAPNTEHFTFAFPMRTLASLYQDLGSPQDEQLLLEFYATDSADSVTDRFSISIDQFEKYF